jgi:hypothetical protein
MVLIVMIQLLGLGPDVEVGAADGVVIGLMYANEAKCLMYLRLTRN